MKKTRYGLRVAAGAFLLLVAVVLGNVQNLPFFSGGIAYSEEFPHTYEIQPDDPFFGRYTISLHMAEELDLERYFFAVAYESSVRSQFSFLPDNYFRTTRFYVTYNGQVNEL